jgi:hypothetical protein
LGDLKVPQTEYSQINTNIITGSENGVITNLQNCNLQRFIDTQNVTAKFFSDSGSESFDNFSKSPYYLFNVEQPRDSWNTALYVRATFSQPPLASKTTNNVSVVTEQSVNMLVAAFYEKVAILTQENGLVTSVEQSEA